VFLSFLLSFPLDRSVRLFSCLGEELDLILFFLSRERDEDDGVISDYERKIRHLFSLSF